MGQLYLQYLDNDDHYLVCLMCGNHLASYEIEYKDHLLLNGAYFKDYKIKDM